jgi:hypothetical protein
MPLTVGIIAARSDARTSGCTASAVWWAKYYVDGRAVRVSTETEDKEAAKRFLKQREGAAATGQPVMPRVDRIRYEELASDLTLQRRQVDLEAGALRLDPGTTKNEEGRVVYLTPELRRLLAEQLARVDQVGRRTGQIIPWLFPRLRGRRAGQPRRNFRKAWATACTKAGVPGMLLHDFRRTAVRNMVNAGVPERVAMKVTGHKTRAVFDRYHIVSPADLQDVVRKLTGTFSGTSEATALDSRRPNP